MKLKRKYLEQKHDFHDINKKLLEIGLSPGVNKKNKTSNKTHENKTNNYKDIFHN